MTSIGEALVAHLAARRVDVMFGIPGVHTVELYRGLAGSGIRHVTPRHEQGAGFMADGYARVSGKPGVALVITGPGLTNILTPMAQALADSVPMLVLSGVNALPSLGCGDGHLHELPDQQAVAGAVAKLSLRVEEQDDLAPVMDRVFAGFAKDRPGPAHIEIPLDVAQFDYSNAIVPATPPPARHADANDIAAALEMLGNARSPVILAGGGMRDHDAALTEMARRLGAPVVLTVNARGLMHRHELVVPASPSLRSVRQLIEVSDLVLAVGTEIGPTDYDMYASGTLPLMKNLIRIDVCPDQLDRHAAILAIHAEAGAALSAMLDALPDDHLPCEAGRKRAAETRRFAIEEIGPEMRDICQVLDILRDAVPGSIMVGDSTQPIYAGNLYYDHDRPGGWFNAATGYGALGYGIPAAIGAAIAAPQTRVLCLVGDGGAQFSLPELMVAVEENLPIVFIIWNNRGYREIEMSMRQAGVDVVGCDPTPPEFRLVAESCGMAFYRCSIMPGEIADVMHKAVVETGPVLLELVAP